MSNKMKDTQENRKEDGRFSKKHIDHNPLEESTRKKFGSPAEKHHK